MAKTGSFDFTRKQWAAIRKMDHTQMKQWMERFYLAAYGEGKQDADGLTYDEMKAVLMSVRGIGERKTELIMEAVEKAIVSRKKPAEVDRRKKDA